MFSSQSLAKQLSFSAPSKHFLLAYSGGLDSHALLHALQPLTLKEDYTLRAIHINHNLQPESKHWAKHCQIICQALEIPCSVINLDLIVKKGDSLEAVAREARYHAFQTALKPQEALITAHHQDDQAETVLLNLFRGSGVSGLAAMPVVKNFANGTLYRPLLDVSRQSLNAYAQAASLSYINDPSNHDQRFDRNFLRHNIIPQLQQRWLGLNKTLTRTARLQGDARQILARQAETDLALMVTPKTTVITIESLKKLSWARQKNCLHYWLQQSHLPVPNEKTIIRILTEILDARKDAQPRVQWKGGEVRRYRQQLYALKPLTNIDLANQLIEWDLKEDLVLPIIQRYIPLKRLGKMKQRLQQCPQTITIRFRQGGERLQLSEKYHKSVKKILQEAGIPPWERAKIPLIYCGEKLVMIVFFPKSY